MSIINQVLKDLDRQRGPANGVQIAALQGVGLVNPDNSRWPVALSVVSCCLAALLLVFTGYYYSTNWMYEADEFSNYRAHTDATTIVTNPVDKPEIFSVEVALRPVPIPTEQVDVETSIPHVTSKEKINSVETVSRPPGVIKTLSPRQKADHAFSKAQRSLDRQDKVRARQQFNTAIDYYPQHMSARIQLAGIYIDQENVAAAESVLQKGLSLDPTHPQLIRLYAQLLASQSNFDKALDILSAITGIEHPDAEALALLAAIHARLDQHMKAASIYQQALQLDSGQANWWLGLGLSLEHQGKNSHAINAYRQANTLPLVENARIFIQQRLQQLQPLNGNR